MSHILRILGTLPLLGILGASFSPAKAAELRLNTTGASVCAAVEGSKTANGTPVIAYSCSGAANYRWNYVAGQFLGIGTANGVSMCLDVKGNGTTPGTLVQLYACNGGLNQQWEMVNGTFFGLPASTVILGLGSALCLDSSGGPSSGGGTQLVMNKCTGGASQNWSLSAMQFQLNSNAPYECASVQGSDTANGTPVIEYSCVSGSSQRWTYNNGALLGLGTASGVSMCLDAKGNGTKPGTLVQLYACNGGQNQQWAIFPRLGTPTVNSIEGVQSGLCLDSAGVTASGGGTQLVLNTCNGAASQQWIVQ